MNAVRIEPGHRRSGMQEVYLYDQSITESQQKYGCNPQRTLVEYIYRNQPEQEQQP
jgi:hypothetical protein